MSIVTSGGVRLAGLVSSGGQIQGGGGGGGPRYLMILWGGRVNAANDFLRVHASGDQGVIAGATGNLTDNIIALPGSINLIKWETFTGTATTTFDMRINGVIQSTITLTAASGVQSITAVPVSAGNTCSMEFTGGTNPQFTTISAFIELS